MVYKSKSRVSKNLKYNVSNQKNSKFDTIDVAILVALIIPFIPP